MSTDLVIDGVQYRTGSLNAKMQFHIARRLAPLIARLGGSITPEGEQSRPLFEVIADAIAKLSDEDCDYIIRVAMSVVTREQTGHWINVWNKAADQPQFADMNVGTLMQLTMAVVQDNLGSFTLAQGGTGQPQATTRPNVH
jgi:hypothetical protein